ncbi:MAG: DNA replication/repair protein RecF [Patescibacteria group bacterium]
MHIYKLVLENFRNYERKEMVFGPAFKDGGMTIVVGPNGAGKTNIVEAIEMLGSTQSFRVSQKEHMILEGAGYFRISAVMVDDNGEECTASVFYQRSPSRQVFEWSDVKLSAGAFFGRLPTVLFLPEHLSLVSSAPKERRHFLDMVLSRMSRKYLETLIRYNKALSARNHLLVTAQEKNVDRREFSYWDDELISQGSELIREREHGLEQINEYFTKAYEAISGESGEGFSIQYLSTVPDVDSYRNVFLNSRDRDLRRAQTHVGPHRDDMVFLIGDSKCVNVCSRGEQRTLILSLKLAETILLAERRNESPILLLDDVFSELDADHRYGLLENISRYQTIVTTVEPYYFKEFSGEHKVEDIAKI